MDPVHEERCALCNPIDPHDEEKLDEYSVSLHARHRGLCASIAPSYLPRSLCEHIDHREEEQKIHTKQDDDDQVEVEEERQRLSKLTGLTNTGMDVASLVLVLHELQDHSDDGDDGGAEDGHGVVQVVPRNLGGPEVVNLPEPQPDIDTETGQPEEYGESGELEEEACDDTATGIGQEILMELVPDDHDQEGERKEEEEGDLDGGHVVVPELVTGAVADDDDDDADDADGHHNQLRRGPDVVPIRVPTHHGHVFRLLDTVVVELV